MKHPVRIAPCLPAGRLDVEGAEGRVVRCAAVPGGSLQEDHVPDETGLARKSLRNLRCDSVAPQTSHWVDCGGNPRNGSA